MEIGSIVYLCVYLVTEIVNYALSYHCFFRVPFNKNKKTWIITILVCMTIHMLIAFRMSLYDATSFSAFTMIMIPVFLLTGERKRRYGLYPFVVFLSSSVAVCVSCFLSVIFQMNINDVVNHPTLNLICQVIPSGLLCIVYVYQKMSKKPVIEFWIGTKQYILYNLGAICVLEMMGSLQIFSKTAVPSRLFNMYCLFTSVSSIILIFLVLWQGISINNEIRLREQLRMNEAYTKLQEDHFNNLIVQDQKMRRFRHDMNAHLTALRGYCTEESSQELLEYIRCISEGFEANKARKYTGDHAVDAVLNHLVEKATKSGIDIDIKGGLGKEYSISSYELCSVFSNTIQNAIEACEKIDSSIERKIYVKMICFNERLVISVENTNLEEVVITNGKLQTTKANKLEHGFGTQNIAEIAKKYNGNVEYSTDANLFRVEIVL